jgi:hypothetical protein
VDASLVGLSILQAFYLLAMAVLGVRLLRLARRTRRLPEALLGAHFVLCCSLGYALLGAGHAGALQPGRIPVVAMRALMAVGHAASACGVFAAVLFTHLTFRRGERWARALVGAVAAALVAGYASYGASGGFTHGRVGGGSYWLLYGSYVAAGCWVLFEPLRYQRALRSRLRLGLADPLVVDRVQLWCVGSAARLVMLVVGALAMLDVSRHPLPAAGLVSNTFFAVAMAGLGVATAYWLAFFPPRAYVAAVARRARAAPG